jgi:hypothetical protein
MMTDLSGACPVCHNARWVCEDHPQEPMHHKLPDGSTCGGAGMPCTRCNEKMDQKPVAVRMEAGPIWMNDIARQAIARDEAMARMSRKERRAQRDLP